MVRDALGVPSPSLTERDEALACKGRKDRLLWHATLTGRRWRSERDRLPHRLRRERAVVHEAPRSLNRIPQLAHVARPCVVSQYGGSPRLECPPAFRREVPRQ